MTAPLGPPPQTGNAVFDRWAHLLWESVKSSLSLSGTLATVATTGAYSDLTGEPTITAGTWTPTLSNTTNIASSTARLSNYIRIESKVICSGAFTIDPTIAGLTTLGISLPVASALTTTYQLRGVANTAIAGVGQAEILGDATNDRATLNWYAPDGTARELSFVFMYEVA